MDFVWTDNSVLLGTDEHPQANHPAFCPNNGFLRPPKGDDHGPTHNRRSWRLLINAAILSLFGLPFGDYALDKPSSA